RRLTPPDGPVASRTSHIKRLCKISSWKQSFQRKLRKAAEPLPAIYQKSRMKLKFRILLIFFAFTILSCKNEKRLEKTEILSNNWEELEINTRIEKIVISKFSDSAEYERNPNNIAFKILREDGKVDVEKIVQKKNLFLKI
ncbi:hypothetical protein JSO62_08570, partial [Riemerella anatipestifer]|uniref:hypothetical protein n=2 Tax=Riemerella anatipestifer TaxID=34085 RepID=UPI0030BEAB31